jgi:hypothetical protein
MPDEATYIGHLMTYEQATRRLGNGFERHVVDVAWDTWKHTIALDNMHEKAQ